MSTIAVPSQLERHSKVTHGSMARETLRDQADRWMRTGHFEDAVGYLGELLQRGVPDRDTLLLAARIYSMHADTYGLADRCFELAGAQLELSVEDYESWLRLWLDRDAGTPALRIVRAMKAAYSEDLAVQRRAALYLASFGETSAAMECALDGLQALPTSNLSDEETADWLSTLRSLVPQDWQPADEHVATLKRLGGSRGIATARICGALLRQTAKNGAVIEFVDGADRELKPHLEADRELALLRVEALVAQRKYGEALEVFVAFPPDDIWSELRYLTCLATVGRLDESRRCLSKCEALLAGYARPVRSAEAQALIDDLDLVVLMYQMVRWDVECNIDRKWQCVRQLVRLEELGYGHTMPGTTAYLLRLRLLLARTWDERTDVLGKLEDVMAEVDDDDVAEYVDALLWTSQLTPPGDSTLFGYDDGQGALRYRGEVAARATIVRNEGQGERLQVLQRARLALLVGDRLTAKTLLDPIAVEREATPDPRAAGSAYDQWSELHVLAWSAIECGRKDDAYAFMKAAMSDWRQDVNARLFFAHVARATGRTEEATVEARACKDAAPQNVPARIMWAECLFDFAVQSIVRDADGPANAVRTAASVTSSSAESPPESASASRSTAEAGPEGGSGGAADSKSSDNLQQLIRVVAEYVRVIKLHNSLAEWIRHPPQDDEPPRGAGSELLSDLAFSEVCRQGLHAAVLASEGLGRLGLTRDRQLEGDVAFLVDQLRVHLCRTGQLKEERTRFAWRRRDEPRRLQALFTAHRLARRNRGLRRVGYIIAGGVVVLLSQAIPLPTELNVGFGFAGLAIMLVPLFPKVKLAGVELALESEKDIAVRRSGLLRSAPVDRFERRSLSALPELPSMVKTRDSDTSPVAADARQRDSAENSMSRPGTTAEGAAQDPATQGARMPRRPGEPQTPDTLAKPVLRHPGRLASPSQQRR